tara:strand:- start:238 stop:672 length:435 start_codon:yes stop_codon:yes gene_type:complete
MKKEELKKLLKPMIKECIKEVIFEEGVLSNIVAEVAQGIGRPTLVEAQKPVQPTFEEFVDREALMEQQKNTANKQREHLLAAIGTEAYGGVNVFEGTTPLSQGGSVSPEPQTQGPLSDVDPHDPGVDISSIMGMAGNRWAAHIK